MVLRASAPKRSAILSCARPKTRRKSLARNLPSLLAANAVIVFTGHLPAGKMLSFRDETERRKKAPADTLPTRTQCVRLMADCVAKVFLHHRTQFFRPVGAAIE